jgi:hypothetical protein
MSFDTDRLHRLKGKGFHDVYSEHPEKWKEMVRTARDYSKTCVPEGEKVKVGDVVAVVQNAIKIDPELEKYLNKKKLTQKFWILWYAEYIVEQTFPQPDLMEDN